MTEVAKVVEYVRFKSVLKVLGEQHRELTDRTPGDWDLELHPGVLEVKRIREVNIEGKGLHRRTVRCFVPLDQVELMLGAVEDVPVRPIEVTRGPPPATPEKAPPPSEPKAAFTPGAQLAAPAKPKSKAKASKLK